MKDSIFTERELKNIQESWEDYYDDDEKAEYELAGHIGNIEALINNGGTLYRALLLDSIDEIDTERATGACWTTDTANIDGYIDNITDFGDENKEVFVVKAIIGPNNISMEGIDVAGNPNEFEVGIKYSEQIKRIEIHTYNYKQVCKNPIALIKDNKVILSGDIISNLENEISF